MGAMLPARRYADWRPVAVRRIPAEWIGAAAGVAAALAFSLAIGTLNYVAFLALGFVAHWTKGRLVERRMQDLRDDPEGGQFAVSMSLYREAAYAFDEGLVAFVDGWLVYSGRRCAFSVRREDVLSVVAKDKRHGFLFRGEAGRHAASFVTPEPARLGAALRAWAEATDVPGEAVFPPTTPTDEARSLHRSWPFLGALVSAVLVVMGLHAHGAGHFLEPSLAALVLPTAVLYGASSQRALDRLARRLPYRRDRLGRLLNLRPLHATEANVRAYALRARRQTALGAAPNDLKT